MNDIHTCSYSCERPACIKAQRDALAASQATITATPSRVTVRVEGVGSATLEVIDGGVDLPLDTVVSMARSAGTSEPTGTDEYLAYLEAAVDEAGFVIKHDGGTLGNSNFRLEPKTQPAAAQEAVAWQVGDEFYPSESLAIEAIQQWGPSGAIAIPLYAAAPVTAAPAHPRALTASIARLDAFLDGDCAELLTPAQSESAALVLQELKRRMASTPAAPGIDIEQFREPVTFWFEHIVTHPFTETNAARLRKAKHLLALIYASPNGDT